MPPKRKAATKKRKASEPASPPARSTSGNSTSLSSDPPLLNLYRAKLLSLAKAHSALLKAVEESRGQEPIDLQSYSQLSASSPPPSPPPPFNPAAPQFTVPHNSLFEGGGQAAWTSEINEWLSRYDATARLSIDTNYDPNVVEGVMLDAPAESYPSASTAVTADLSQCSNVRVGVGVLIKRPGSYKVFAGVRKGSHGAGTLALPGGHLEFGESWAACATREVEEECGVNLDPTKLKLVHVTNDPMPDENKHYITLFMGATCEKDDVLVNAEPHKCEGWEEFCLDELEEVR